MFKEHFIGYFEHIIIECRVYTECHYLLYQLLGIVDCPITLALKLAEQLWPLLSVALLSLLCARILPA